LEQSDDVDSSYHYYDNLRGKINSRILTDLVTDCGSCFEHGSWQNVAEKLNRRQFLTGFQAQRKN
jgi:hypothetical protein